MKNKRQREEGKKIFKNVVGVGRLQGEERHSGRWVF